MSINAKQSGDMLFSDSIGVEPGALPEVRSEISAGNLQSWVSTRYVPPGKAPTPQVDSSRFTPPHKETPHWYVLRTTYGQEKKAYDYMVAKNITAFLPRETVVKLIKGKRKQVEQSLISNLFFAYGTEKELQEFVYDNHNLPFLRFYYRRRRVGNDTIQEPLIVPDKQMATFRIICETGNKDIIVSTRDIPRFHRGEMARVIDGPFAGVEGRVVRYKAQQRVGIIIEGLGSVATSYIPEAFLERMEENPNVM